MNMDLKRQSWTVVLVFGAMIFGMVLAGGLDLTPHSVAQVGPDSGQAVTMPAAVGGLPSFADLASAVSPAVVSIQVARIEEAESMGGLENLERFLNPRRQGPQSPPQPQQRRRADASGSGFVVSGDGYVVTNHHVIEDATDLSVVLGGRQYPAEVKGIDPATDLALLKIEPEEELDYLEFADSDAVRVGDWLMVIGSPLRLENSVSVGVVSAKGRSINITADRSLENFIQTDAAINFGNSGGPLVDLQGRVIGIATAINFGAENIGFAVPVNTLKTILPQLRESGAVSRGYLGVSIDDLDHEEAAAFGLDSTNGALITGVTEDGPAAASELRHGDIILQVGEHEIINNRDLIDYVSARRPGEKVKVKVFRAGKTLTKTVVLGERPSMDGAQAVVRELEAPEEDDEPVQWMGITLDDLTQALREGHGVPTDLSGVLVTDVAPDSPLYDKGMRPMDIIQEANGQPVTSLGQLKAMLDQVESGGYMRFYVARFNPRSGQAVSFFVIVRAESP